MRGGPGKPFGVYLCLNACSDLILVQHLLLQFLHQLTLQVDLVILRK